MRILKSLNHQENDLIILAPTHHSEGKLPNPESTGIFL